MKKLLLLLGLILVSLGLPAWANDATYYTSGNQLVPLQETDISVRKEVLTISILNNGFARVDVYYEFWNPCKQVRQLLMGFEANPPYNDDWKFHPDGVHPNISEFMVEMNGLRLAYRNAVCRSGLDTLSIVEAKDYMIFDDNRIYEEDPAENDQAWDKGIEFAYVYYFTADFQPGLNKVHHTYSYKMSRGVGMPWQISYKLSPASRWANHQIDDFTLVVRSDNTAKHFLIKKDIFPGAAFAVAEGKGKVREVKYWDIDYCEFALRNGSVQTHIANFRPNEELIIESAFRYDQPIGHFYDPYYGLKWFFYGDFQSAQDNLQNSPFLKRVRRNLPFAYRGHVFKDKALREFFENQWWYMPDPNYHDDTSDFTELDHLYIQGSDNPSN